MARKRRTQSSGFAPTVASRPELSTRRDDASAVPTAPESLPDGQIWTEPDAMADLAGTDEFVLPPSRSREHWPVLGSEPELEPDVDEAAATTKSRAPSSGFHDAPTMAAAKPAGGFHDARTQLKNPPVQSFFELPTEQLGKIHDEATDLQIAAPEARRPVRRPPSSSRIKQVSPSPSPTRSTRSTGPTQATRSPRARWPLVVAAVAVGLLVAAAVVALMLRETPRRLAFGSPLEHGPWRLVLIGAEEGLNTAGKPALRVSLRLGRAGQVMRASDVQLLMLDARGQTHAPYALKRLIARAELGQSGLWRAEYRLHTSPPYRLRFAPPGEPVVDFELVMPARPSP